MPTSDSIFPLYQPGDSVDDVLVKLDQPLPDLTTVFGIPYSRVPGFSPIFRNKHCLETLYNLIHPDYRTGFDLFKNNLNRNPNHKFLAYRQFNSSSQSFNDYYTYLTNQQVADHAANIGSGVLYLLQNVVKDTISDPHKEIITIYTPNCPQFVILDLAFQAFNITSTCLYDTLGQTASSHILSLTNTPFVFTSKSKIESVAALKIKDDISSLKILVSIEPLDLAKDYLLFAAAKKANIYLYDWSSVAAIGTKNLQAFTPATSDDVYTITFTSGTTSTPKGAIVTHKNLAAFVLNNLSVMSTTKKFDKSNKAFVFLPLAHCFARLCFYYEAVLETTFYFPHNPSLPASYFEDIKILKPRSICLVPRVLTRIELLLKEKFATSKYLSKIIATKIEYLERGEVYPHFIYDKLVCPKIRSTIGFDNLKLVICGGAQVSRDSLLFLIAALNVNILQGYGLTETMAGIFISTPLLEEIGTAGPIGCASEFRLRDVPEMGYTFDKNKSGEIWIRGDSIVAGYFKDPEKTKESFNEEGWFKTGDIGKLTGQNKIVIIDRIKNIFKLAQGKFIAAESIENVYNSSNLLIEQIFIWGDGLQSYLVAIVGINLDHLAALFKQKNIKYDQLYKAINAIRTNGDEKFANELLQYINQVTVKKVLLKELNGNIKEDLNSYEFVKNVHFAITPFSTDSDTMTPTLKIKRQNAREQWKDVIDKLYKEGSILAGAKL